MNWGASAAVHCSSRPFKRSLKPEFMHLRDAISRTSLDIQTCMGTNPKTGTVKKGTARFEITAEPSHDLGRQARQA
jgi:hypothetical protein